MKSTTENLLNSIKKQYPCSFYKLLRHQEQRFAINRMMDAEDSIVIRNMIDFLKATGVQPDDSTDAEILTCFELLEQKIVTQLN